MSGTTCDVCNNEPSVGVACIPGIPMSVAYGKRCLQEDAHPFAYVRANLSCCLSADTAERWEDPDIIRQDYIDSMNTFYKGRYMPLREALRLQPFTRAELEEFDRYEEYCKQHPPIEPQDDPEV